MINAQPTQMFWKDAGVYRDLSEFPVPDRSRQFYVYDWNRQVYRKASAQEVTRWYLNAAR